MTTEALKRKKYKKRKTRLSYGPRGLETLRLCFQCGGVTPRQHARFFDVNIRNSYRLLSSLGDQRLLESAPIQTNGRPRDFHHLSKANASRAIAIAGHEAGLGERLAKEHYRFHGLPQNVEHAHARNEFYLSVLEASREEGSAADVPLWEMWGESLRGFPLRGSKKVEKVFPDGQFEVGFDSELSCRYYLEYESRSRPGEVLRKLDGYGAHFSRCLKEDGGNVQDWLRPVVFLFKQNSTAVHIVRVLTGARLAKAPELGRFRAWQRDAGMRGLHAGRLILVGSLEDIGRRGVFDSKFGALEKYPGDASVADLRAAAKEVSGVVTRARRGASR